MQLNKGDEYGVESQIALAEAIMAEFGRQEGAHPLHPPRAGQKGGAMEKLGIDPRGIDREIVEIMHRNRHRRRTMIRCTSSCRA